MSEINSVMESQILSLFKEGESIKQIIDFYYSTGRVVTEDDINNVLRKNIRDDI